MVLLVIADPIDEDVGYPVDRGLSLSYIQPPFCIFVYYFVFCCLTTLITIGTIMTPNNWSSCKLSAQSILDLIGRTDETPKYYSDNDFLVLY